MFWELRAYMGAMLHHWKASLTGGLLMAVAAALQFGGMDLQPMGWAFLGGSFVVASFSAWRDQRTKRVLRAEITGVNVQKDVVIIAVHLTNLSQEIRGVDERWDVVITTEESFVRLHGRIAGEIRPLAPEEQFNVSLVFMNSDGLHPLDARIFTVSGADVHGNKLVAHYPETATLVQPGSGRLPSP